MKYTIFFFTILLSFGTQADNINQIQQIIVDQVTQAQAAAAAARARLQQNPDPLYQPTNDDPNATPGNATPTEIQQSNAAAGLGLNNTDQYKDAQKRLQEAQAQASQNTINQGSKKGKKSQSSGAMINMGAAAALMAACMATKPPNIPLCIMGAQAAQQGAHDKGASGKSGKTYDASKMGFSNSATVEEVASEDTGSAGFDPKIQEGLDQLKKEGYAVTETGVRFPDGSLKPHSAFNNAASMSAAGIDPKIAGDAAAVLAKMNLGAKEDPNQPHLLNIAVDGSGGGGGYNPSSAGGSGSSGGTESYNPWAMNAEARRKLVEGKSMNLAGEPIGVKGDDLFDMVHRAYEKKRKTANFIEDVEMRVPASVPAKRLGH